MNIGTVLILIYFYSLSKLVLLLFPTYLLTKFIVIIFPSNRWKYYEVILLCIGYVQQSVLEKVENGELKDEFRNSLKEMLITACSTDAGLYIFNPCDTYFPMFLA